VAVLSCNAQRIVCGLVVALLGVASSAVARDESAESRNSLYVELLGTAVLYSINYDRVLLTVAERHRVGFRVGFSVAPIDTGSSQFPIIVPITANYLFGRQHRLEIGAGIATSITFSQGWSPSARVSPAATLGYRMQRFDNDFVLRFGFTPLWFSSFQPWFGLSLGRAF
jgi:hypothetical protein